MLDRVVKAVGPIVSPSDVNSVPEHGFGVRQARRDA